VGTEEEITATKDVLMESEVGEIKNLRLHQDWEKIKPMLPVV
jgi:ribulose 1,5-bisphosphate carboxylase large subunit-like protein